MSALLEYLKKGGDSLSEVQKLLDDGADVNYSNGFVSVLHVYAWKCNNMVMDSLGILKLLIERGANVNDRSRLTTYNHRSFVDLKAYQHKRWTPLMYLLHYGSPLENLHILLCEGADTNFRDFNGHSVLQIFVNSHYSKIDENSLAKLKLLIEWGACVDSFENEEGNTPFTLFLSRMFPADHLEIVLNVCKNVNGKDRSGDTLLHTFVTVYSSNQGEQSLNVLKALLKRVACVDADNREGKTLLRLLVEKGFPADHLELVLCRRANIHCTDKCGNNLLHVFADSYYSNKGLKSLNVLKLLLEFGLDLHAYNTKGQTPLMLMLQNRFPVDNLELALSKAANINHKGDAENSLLHNFIDSYWLKTGSDRFEILNLLLRKGAIVDVVNGKGETPIMLLIRKRIPVNRLEAILAKSVNVNIKDVNGNNMLHHFADAYFCNADEDSLKILKLLLERGVDINHGNIKGVTPYMLLLEKGFPLSHLEIILRKDIDLSFKDIENNNVLHYFARGVHTIGVDSLNIFKSLVERGAKVDGKNTDGETPFMLLVENRFPFNYLQVILDKGAEMSGPYWDYPHVLNYLLNGNHLSNDLLRSLLEYGADPNETDAQGTPILYTSLLKKNFYCTQMLCSLGADIDLRSEWGRKIVESYLKSGSKNQDGGYEIVLKYALLKDRACLRQYLNDETLKNVGKLSTFVIACYTVLAELKSRCLNQQVTAYDFLIETKSKNLGKFMRCSNTELANLEAEFPFFAEIIWSKKEIGSRWANILEKFDRLYLSVDGVSLNHDCIRYVTRYLNDYQFAKLVNSSEFIPSIDTLEYITSSVIKCWGYMRNAALQVSLPEKISLDTKWLPLLHQEHGTRNKDDRGTYSLTTSLHSLRSRSSDLVNLMVRSVDFKPV